MQISIAGSGMVGTTIGNAFEFFGNDVIYLDINDRRIDDLKSKGRKAYKIDDPAAPLGELTFVAVPTPTTDISKCTGLPSQDLSYIVAACKTLAMMATTRILVIKSTILPGTIRSKIYPLIRDLGRSDIKIYHNPEFLTEKNADYDFLHNRVVIGTDFGLYGYKDDGIYKLLELYKPFKTQKIVVTWEEAEMIKYAANLALANKVAYWCEINEICQKLHISPSTVAEICGMDKRIGTYGFRPIGTGFAGHCLPKDLEAFHTWIRDFNYISGDMDLFGPMIKLNKYITGSAK